MIKYTFLFVFLLSTVFCLGNDISDVRLNYKRCIADKELCRRLIVKLEGSKNPTAIELAYLGGLKTIWANHVFSPIAKLSTFKEGRKDIERAIRQDPKNPELRFVRLSIQKNAPSFLGFKSNIAEDRRFIQENWGGFEPDMPIADVKALIE